jgi:hypothetical protein
MDPSRLRIAAANPADVRAPSELAPAGDAATAAADSAAIAKAATTARRTNARVDLISAAPCSDRTGDSVATQIYPHRIAPIR